MDYTITEMDKYKVITLSGNINWEKAKSLDNTIQELIKKDQIFLAIDLNEVIFFCSGALGTLAYNYSVVNKVNGGLYLINSTNYIKNLLESVYFHKIFEGHIFESLESFQEVVICEKDTSVV